VVAGHFLQSGFSWEDFVLLVAHLPTLHESPERKTGELRQVGEW
jgi:hypothetical protein